jgi:hypothetical protein
MAAFSSSPSLLSFSFEEVDFRGVEDSPSIDCREVTSALLGPAFSENWLDRGSSAVSAWCFSAIAETARSTFRSNSSSEIVNVVRSKFSMNCTAPSFQ